MKRLYMYRCCCAGRAFGAKVRRPVSLIDLLLTLLEAAGLPPAPGIAGHSFLPRVRQSGEPAPIIRPAILAEQPYGILPQMLCPPDSVLADLDDPCRYMKPWGYRDPGPREAMEEIEII